MKKLFILSLGAMLFMSILSIHGCKTGYKFVCYDAITDSLGNTYASDKGKKYRRFRTEDEKHDFEKSFNKVCIQD